MISLHYPHQYVDRQSCKVVTEKLLGDRTVNFLYNSLRESAPRMFHALTSKRMSSLLGYVNYDMVGRAHRNSAKLFAAIGADWQECVEPLYAFKTARQVFERKIRYWEVRPMEHCPDSIVAPADSRVLLGSYSGKSPVFIKNKFFEVKELLGDCSLAPRFFGGEYCVFRLTPDKYHYNHVPVGGKIVQYYSMDGEYHSCNPIAQMAVASLCAKNRRIVTVIDTDVEGGAYVGIVAMVEIVALMIGDIQQTYSVRYYDDPCDIREGMTLVKGCPKSLFRPGSSTVVLLFEPGRIQFANDLVANSRRVDVQSRYTAGLKKPLVETDVKVRSTIAFSRNTCMPLL